MKYIRKEWGVTNKYFYGADDISFVDDPFTPDSDDKTLRVLYEKGSFSPQATRRQKNDVSGGAEFYARPFNGTYKRGLLSYEIAFDDGFKWVKGGKLPGLYGGEPTSGCSGGDKADGEKCFSVRMMWRSQGKAEAYAYLPPEDDAVCENSKVICNDEYGTSIGRGLIKFTQKKWSKIEIYTVMNDPDQHNGELTVWQDNRTVIDLKGLVFRTQKTLGVSSMLFSTFFGGSSKEYATPIDTYTYFKNIQFSVADPEQSEPSNTESAASSLLLTSFSSINMVWLMTTTITVIIFCMNFFDQ
ncbi:hypothetical protein BDC45DRAFT_434413 [Circinella umbellata]|nr:hypothetical protein BDC45DRAFT_434413 [Circinella umbellata]